SCESSQLAVVFHQGLLCRSPGAHGGAFFLHSRRVLCSLILPEPKSAARVFGSLAGRTGQVIVASRADEYRLRAQRCLEMAGAFSDRDSRLTLSHMAQAWLGLADRYQGVEKTQPAFQQQQQAQPKQAQRGSAGLAKDRSTNALA